MKVLIPLHRAVDNLGCRSNKVIKIFTLETLLGHGADNLLAP